MPKEFNITIPSNATLSSQRILRVSFSRADLHAPKKICGPYSNPQGADRKSLNCTLCKAEGGTLSENAVKFDFDFEKDNAVFSFDPNLVIPSSDKGLFEFELKGN